jgi:peptide-methionine (S)-S-oxide reductase
MNIEIREKRMTKTHRQLIYSFALICGFVFFAGKYIQITPAKAENNLSKAIFAGGCFWCLEADLEKVKGVEDVVSGYTGGHVPNPTYKQVTSGNTGHYEAVKVTFNKTEISYEELIKYYWQNIDPFNDEGQFCDTGNQYKAAIFYEDQEQLDIATKTKKLVEKKLKKQLKTEILEASTFYEAEEYHQNYAANNAAKYNFYRWRCGRDKRLNEIWDSNKNENPPFKFYKDE